MQPIIISAQCLGLFPVIGITEKTASALQFRWFSLRTILSVTVMTSALLVAIAELRRIARTGVNFSNIINPYFFADTAIIVGLLIRLGGRWEHLMVQVENVERLLLKPCYNLRQVHLKRNCWLAAGSWLVLATAEHFFATTSFINDQRMESLRCNWTYTNAIENYARRNYAYVFNLPWMPYNIPVLLYLRYVTFSVTLAWTYQDVLLIVVCIYMNTRYRQFFTRIEVAASVDRPPPAESFWSEIRYHYIALSDLLQSMNYELSALVINSCSNNIFLVCYILLHSLGPKQSALSFTYFWFAVCFFIGRTCTVMLTAAKFDRTLKRALQVVHRIPNEGWCDELSRYYHHLRSEKVFLSGKRFFYLTRRTAFGMFSVIFTIEIVMIKYSKMARNSGVPADCSTLAFSQD
ncbi:hypothetical protein quinque_003789 [Culex quinquefasciatus]